MATNPGHKHLVAWWSLDETSGTRADSRGNNDLTDYNTVGNGTGKQSNAASFVETNNEALYIADNANLSFGDEDFTITAWAKIDTAGFMSILAKRDGTTNRAYILWYFNDKVRWAVSDDGNSENTVDETTTGAWSTDTWYFVAAYHDATANTIGVSVNAGTFDTDPHTGGCYDNTAEFNIGATSDHTSSWFDGDIDEVNVWNTVLTQDEIDWLYNTGSGRAYSDLGSDAPTNPETDNLVAWWSMDEASGTRADSHGSNDLTDHNTVGSATGKKSNAADFTSANSEALYIADNADLSFGDEDFTICGWVSLDSKSASRAIVGKWHFSGSSREYYLGYSSGPDRIAFFVSSDGTGNTSVSADNLGSPSTSTWYFVAAYHDATANEIGISVNAGAIDTTAHTTGANDGSSEFNIGSYNNHAGNFQEGQLDEICLFDKVLSRAEMDWLYNSGSGRAYSEFSPLTTNNLDIIPRGVLRGVMRGT